MGEMRNTYEFLVRKLEEKRPLGRPRHRWEDNIRLDLEEMRWEAVDLIHLTQDKDQWWALVNTVMNLRVSYKAGGGGEFLDQLSYF
jgi:hypothetical protein